MEKVDKTDPPTVNKQRPLFGEKHRLEVQEN